MRVLFCLSFLFSLIGFQVWADAIDPSIHREYESIRALGMGNAFTAIANDYSGLFYNPASLARREDGEVNLSLDLAASSEYTTIGKEIQDASNTTGGEDKQIEAIMEVIKKNYGKYYHLRTAPTSGVWVRPNWGLGIIPADITVNMTLHNLGAPATDVTVFGDTTIAFGLAKDFNSWLNDGRFSLGFTTKAVHRAYFSEALSAVDLAANSDYLNIKRFREGAAVDADVGALWTPDIPGDGIIGSTLRLAKPSFSMVVRNIAESNFTDLNLISKEPSEQPQKMYRRLDLGSRWEYPSLWIFGGRGSLDIRDIGHPNWTARKGFHAGLEFDWRVFSWWKGQYRVGINQGYFTAGLSALFTIFNLDLVTYGEEVGSVNSPKESRRYALRASLNF